MVVGYMYVLVRHYASICGALPCDLELLIVAACGIAI